MHADRLQVAVWLLTPVIGLALLLTVMTARTGTLIIPLIAVLLLILVAVAGLLRHGMTSTS